MTAPAITPSVAPVTPIAAPGQVAPQITPVFQQPAKVEPAGLNAMIEKIAREGQGASPEAAPVAEAAPAATTAPDGTITPAPVAIGAEGELLVDGDDITLRAERDANGQYKTKIDPSIKFDIAMRDPETGEMRTYTKSIPEVLRMARDGVWGQKVKDEVKYYRENVSQWQESHQTLTQKAQQATQEAGTLRDQLDAQMALNRELLTAPEEFVIQRREEFAQEMSPEKRLAKLEERLARERDASLQTQAQQQRAQQADHFVQTRLAPVLQEAEAALGGNQYAKRLVAGQVALATTPLLVNGQLPPESWPKLEAYLRGEFQTWVRETASYYSSQRSATETLRKSQQVAQAAVNSAGQLLRPVGQVNGSMAPAPQGPPKDMNDAITRIINRPLANTG